MGKKEYAKELLLKQERINNWEKNHSLNTNIDSYRYGDSKVEYWDFD